MQLLYMEILNLSAVHLRKRNGMAHAKLPKILEIFLKVIFLLSSAFLQSF
jgi:hypothetical protein